MAFGPKSTNPRERRSFAHAKLANIKQGESDYSSTFEAIKAASHGRKGSESGFSSALSNVAVVLVDWSATSFATEGVVHHNFGGYVMPRAETKRWTTLGKEIRGLVDRKSSSHDLDSQDPRLDALHQEHNQRFNTGYEQVTLTRVFDGPAGSKASPSMGDVINPLDIADVTPFVPWNDKRTQ